MIITDRAASVNPFSQTFSKTLRISMIIAKEGHMPFTLSPQQRVSGTADTAVRRWRRLYAQGERAQWPPSAAGDAGVSRQRQKGQEHQGFPAPLDSPTFPWDATPFGRASKCEGPTGTSGAPRVHH